ncbi:MULTISPECIES: GNAT family N-acetyltransferase [Rhodopseudomonas]|uniref:Acetyltransferase n=1 Tax=Rhodopseudomonas palustris TaxID=1076 RepID=A0A0D7E1Y3_RHOPL|nr:MULTISPECIES: GNAT family N-acetyltransferase [Rhodopseudomonas]KIZ34475.1 acetyltransferase [Rhodopseudomonas palustris]MDF3814357.1 GNAT family N-acetyltransferase [Rhodopseudomonas sp. BAL398]WOK18053.1 GNAT family N-acetyltransferase [Rhodopseudomonas sp. BAL398]
MSIEIEVLSGDASWPRAKPLLDTVWPPEAKATLPWGNIEMAHATLRVLIDSPEGLLCHVGLHLRTLTWNDRKCEVGGIGGVATHPDCRRRGYASIALNAAIQTLRDHEAVDFGLLFCEPRHAAFYGQRGWAAFDGEVYAEQAGQRIRFDAIAARVFDLRLKPRQGVIDLCGLPW